MENYRWLTWRYVTDDGTYDLIDALEALLEGFTWDS